MKPSLVPELAAYLTSQTERCLRPPIDRFDHDWVAPMPMSASVERWLRAREGGASARLQDDGFQRGDYSLGLFHHDASEASIWLLTQPEFRAAAAGSLLCMLDCAEPSGRVHRALLPHKAREYEPAKPVIAQYARRCVDALGVEWADRHAVLPRVTAFLRFVERHYVGLHGLFLTHSSLASGFDSDLLSAGFPDSSVEGPDTNAFMVLEYEALADLATRLGQTVLAAECTEKAAALRQLMHRLLWVEDDKGGFYAALRWVHGVGSLEEEYVRVKTPGGGFAPLETWASLLPLYARVPPPAAAEKLIGRMLRPEGYWGPSGIRTLPAWSPFFAQAPRVMHFDFKKNGRGPVSNWSGPVWVLSNYYLAMGLLAYQHKDDALVLAARTVSLLEGDLAATQKLHECYDDKGRGLWPIDGTFVSWNVLALVLAELG